MTAIERTGQFVHRRHKPLARIATFLDAEFLRYPISSNIWIWAAV